MKKKLSNIVVDYDEKTGVISLTSKDKQVKGKPFQVKIASATPTYETLLSLFDVKETLPTAKGINNIAELKVPGKDPRTAFYVGETYNGKQEKFDLSFSPHTLIVGSPGGGKSVLQRNIITHALSEPLIKVKAIDLKQVELKDYPWREQDTLATNFEDSFELLDDLLKEMYETYDILEKLQTPSYLDVSPKMKVTYLIIDELAMFNPKVSKDPILEQKIRKFYENLILLARVGRSAGVYLFIATQRADSILSGEFLSNLGRRVCMGNISSETYIKIMGSPKAFGGALTTHPGRTVVKTYNNDSIFQTYFIAHHELPRMLENHEHNKIV